MNSTLRFSWIAPLAVFLLAAYLPFAGLNANSFWGDEASTAFSAKAFLTHGALTGIKTAWDGKNLLTTYRERVLDERFQKVGFQTDVLIAATGLKLFGNATWAGRLPFVLLGLCALGVFWLVLKEEYPHSSMLRLYAFTLVGLSYSFLLSIRQCQYYAPGLFFAILAYYGYRKALSTRKAVYWLLQLAAVVLLFFTHLLFAGCFVLALAITHVVFHREVFGRKEWGLTIAGAAIFTAMTLWYVVSTNVLNRPSAPGSAGVEMSKFILLYWHLRELDLINYLPGLVVLAMIPLAWRYRNHDFFPTVFFEHAVFIGAYVAVLSVLSPQPVKWQGAYGGMADVRYLLPLLPFCASIVAVFLSIVHRALHPVVSVVLLLVILSSNALSLGIAGRKARWLLPAYIYEVHNDYQTPYDAAVEYLAKNATPADTIYAAVEYNAIPLIFYLGDSLTFGGRLEKSEHLLEEKIRSYGAPVFIDEYYPTLLVFFGKTKKNMQLLQHFARGPYAYEIKDQIKIHHQDMTRPELPQHRFGPIKRYNPNTDAIYIFQRKPKGTNE